MKKVLLSTALCASMMFAANSDYKYEITPMISGAFTEGNLDIERNYANAGLALGFNLDESMFDQVEIGFLRNLSKVEYTGGSNEETNITRVFTNLVKDYSFTDSLSLYGLAGAGVQWYGTEAMGNETGMFGNYGVGLKYKITEMVSLKTDVRHLVTLDGDSDNNLLYTVGLAIPFGKKAAPAPEPIPVPKPTPAPLDSDNDGVIDSLDQCPNSPVGAVVNSKGCEVDTDGDGVVDSKDKCPTTPKGNIVDADGCTLKVNLNINFKTDSAVIDESYGSKIKKFADFMKAFPAVKGKIEAHTDSIGSTKYNQKLSEKRAASAVQALEAQGIEGTRLNSIGYGETMPKASNETAEGRAENRRVEGSIQQ